jgi:hypothetical protein
MTIFNGTNNNGGLKWPGNTIGFTPVTSTGSLAINAYCLGASLAAAANSWGDSPMNGKIAEFIAYNRELTSTEQSNVISYLITRYGLT